MAVETREGAGNPGDGPVLRKPIDKVASDGKSCVGCAFLLEKGDDKFCKDSQSTNTFDYTPIDQMTKGCKGNLPSMGGLSEEYLVKPGQIVLLKERDWS